MLTHFDAQHSPLIHIHSGILDQHLICHKALQFGYIHIAHSLAFDFDTRTSHPTTHHRFGHGVQAVAIGHNHAHRIDFDFGTLAHGLGRCHRQIGDDTEPQHNGQNDM